jgi:high-affinity iron transporter
VWDTSFLLSDQGIVGKILHTLIGYTAQPAGIQIIFYLATLAVIATLMRVLGPGVTTARGERAVGSE